MNECCGNVIGVQAERNNIRLCFWTCFSQSEIYVLLSHERQKALVMLLCSSFSWCL